MLLLLGLLVPSCFLLWVLIRNMVLTYLRFEYISPVNLVYVFFSGSFSKNEDPVFILGLNGCRSECQAPFPHVHNPGISCLPANHHLLAHRSFSQMTHSIYTMKELKWKCWTGMVSNFGSVTEKWLTMVAIFSRRIYVVWSTILASSALSSAKQLLKNNLIFLQDCVLLPVFSLGENGKISLTALVFAMLL